MDKKRAFLQTLTLSAGLLVPGAAIFATEVDRDLAVSKPKNVAKIIKPSDVPEASLKNVRKVALLLTSTLPLFGEMAEDQLAMKLRDAGFEVTRRARLLDLSQKELLREQVRGLQDELNIYRQQLREQLELEKQLEKEQENLKELRRLEQRIDQVLQQMQKAPEAGQGQSLDVVEVGSKLGLDAAIVGTIFEGKQQISLSDEKPPRMMERIVVSTFYVQVINVKTEQIVLSIMLEYDKGESITNAIDTMAKLIKDELK